MHRLTNPVRHYDWGSVTAIPELLGREPDGRPHAELWMGAHPDDPSTVDVDGQDVPLDALVDKDPVAVLGARDAQRFDGRLPFLLKVLAAQAPLSLQVHPDAETAARRYADELAAGVPDAERSYRDPQPKPELLCALTRFEVLCGFRPPAESAELLAGVLAEPAPWLLEGLRADGEPGAVLRRVVEAVLTGEQDDTVAAVARAASARLADGSPAADVDRTLVDLADRYPGDRGVLIAALMHRRTLLPGQAAFLGAGVAHAYLNGLGVEVLASSDNVLRGGLTSKRVDVPELLSVLDVGPQPEPVLDPVEAEPGRLTYPVPVAQFSLERLQPPADRSLAVPAGAARVLLVVAGQVTVTVAGRAQRLGRGESALAPAHEALDVQGEGTVFVASSGKE